jgi:hypothetical protein
VIQNGYRNIPTHSLKPTTHSREGCRPPWGCERGNCNSSNRSRILGCQWRWHSRIVGISFLAINTWGPGSVGHGHDDESVISEENTLTIKRFERNLQQI